MRQGPKFIWLSQTLSTIIVLIHGNGLQVVHIFVIRKPYDLGLGTQMLWLIIFQAIYIPANPFSQGMQQLEEAHPPCI